MNYLKALQEIIIIIYRENQTKFEILLEKSKENNY